MSKSKKKKTNQAQVGAKARLLWSPGGARLFDPDGHEYRSQAADFSSDEVQRLARNGQVPFAIKECGGPVEWFSARDAATAWDRIRPDFQDVEDWKPPADAPGAWQYAATLWTSITGDQQVLLLSDE